MEHFSFLSAEDINSVLLKAEIKVFQKEELFIKEGDTRREIAFVVKGIMRLYKLKKGIEYTCMIRDENKVVGNIESILLGVPSTRYIAALEETTLAIINYDTLSQTLGKNEKLNDTRIRILEQNLAMAIRKIDDYIIYTPEERYIKLLEDQPDIQQRVPQKYIASFLGITPVSLSRIRKRINV